MTDTGAADRGAADRGATERGAAAGAERTRLRRPEGPRPGVGIVHLGLGAFYRAHGAIYVAEAMVRSGGAWASSV
jgi:hypothetical protein